MLRGLVLDQAGLPRLSAVPFSFTNSAALTGNSVNLVLIVDQHVNKRRHVADAYVTIHVNVRC